MGISVGYSSFLNTSWTSPWLTDWILIMNAQWNLYGNFCRAYPILVNWTCLGLSLERIKLEVWPASDCRGNIPCLGVSCQLRIGEKSVGLPNFHVAWTSQRHGESVWIIGFRGRCKGVASLASVQLGLAKLCYRVQVYYQHFSDICKNIINRYSIGGRAPDIRAIYKEGWFVALNSGSLNNIARVYHTLA